MMVLTLYAPTINGREVLGYYDSLDKALLELDQRFHLIVSSVVQEADLGYTIHIAHSVYRYAILSYTKESLG